MKQTPPPTPTPPPVPLLSSHNPPVPPPTTPNLPSQPSYPDPCKFLCRLVLQVVTAQSLAVVELAVAVVAESSRSAASGIHAGTLTWPEAPDNCQNTCASYWSPVCGSYWTL